MPELPEVEVTRRGIEPHLVGETITGVTVRNARLRWPVPDNLPAMLTGQCIEAVQRRGKYLLIALEHGWIIWHLGMSGSLRIVRPEEPVQKHDHLDLLLGSGQVLRYRDPRRFGTVLWTTDPQSHPLIRVLGVEPLSPAFSGSLLYTLSRNKRVPVKQFLMDAHLIVGVGNIYANEALFHAGISPDTPAGSIGRTRYDRLAEAIRAVLIRAIEAGGSSLRDFVHSDGRPGYFQQEYFVYGRAEQGCRRCNTPIRLSRHQGRATFHCPGCQKR